MKPATSSSTHDAALERLLLAPDLAADDALMALAARFAAGCDRAAVLDRLDEAARDLFGAAALDPRERADALADMLTDELALRPVTHDHRALLVDRAIGCSADAPTPGGPLHALCPHQLAFALLAHLGHDGPPAWHARAAHLMHRLPTGHHEDADG